MNDCKHCSLKAQPYIPAEGRGNIMLIGEAGGEDEAKLKRPFVGASGVFLQELLKIMGIKREDCYITNAVKCHPKSNRTPTKKMRECCKPLLELEIRSIKPKLIITLGATAFHHFMPYPISAYHGRRIKLEGFSWGAVDLIPMYHPAAALHNASLKEVIKEDFKKALKKPYVQPIQGIYELGDWHVAPVNDKVSIDTETTGKDRNAELVGAAFGHKGRAEYMVAEDAVNYLKQGTPDQAIFYNAKFDLQVFARNRIPFNSWKTVDDAMVLAYCMNLPIIKLKDFVMQELNLSMLRYEDVAPEGGTLADVDPETVAQYCGSDADGTWRLFHHLWDKASSRERKVYEQLDRPIIPIVAEMEHNGVYVDIDFLDLERDKVDEQIKDIVTKTEKLYGLTETIISSPKQLGDFIVKELGIKLTKKTDANKQWKTDIDILYPLRVKHPAIEDIIKFKELDKLRGTFIEGILKRAVAGVIYPTFNQTQTATGRFSCSNPNLQTLPHSGGTRMMIIAPPGMSVVSLDNSQIELRVIAWLSKDPRLLAIFEDEDADPHRESAAFMFGEAKADELRWISKQANYAVSYGGSYRALLSGKFVRVMDEDTAIRSIERYFEVFPRVKVWIDDTKVFALENGYTETTYGRRRYIPQLFSSNPYMREEALRQAINNAPQGTAADINKLQMQAVAKICKPVLQVHDELVFYVPDRDLKEVIPELKRAMTKIDFPVKIKVGCEVGKNFGQMEEWHE